MEPLNFCLIYMTKSNKWRVFADPAGMLILFTTLVAAQSAGDSLLDSKAALTYAVLDVREAHHVARRL